MPKLITQRDDAKRVTPPCGRLINYVEPHSPFQKLVEARRRELGFSGRALAKKVKVAQSTLWIWLHSENGYPHPKAFKDHHLQTLATVLKIEPGALQDALDASRHLYTPRENPMPHASLDAFRTFIEILDRDPRIRVTMSYVTNLARNLYNGAMAGDQAALPAPPAPAAPTPTRRPSRPRAHRR